MISQSFIAPPFPHLYFENFETNNSWFRSNDLKYQGDWAIEETYPPQGRINEYAIVQKSRNCHHAISTRLENPIRFQNDTFILQYEFRSQHSFTCSGAYIKLISDQSFNPFKFNNETDWVIMFGPDRCGSKKNIQLIFNLYNPSLNSFQERILKEPPTFRIDHFSHIVTLILRPDLSFSILFDNTVIRIGNLLTDFDPPIVPPYSFPNLSDSKPSNWDENPFIYNYSAQKPDDWDESQPYMIPDSDSIMPPSWFENESWFIPDQTIMKPLYWNSDILGVWEPPLIFNPKCTTGCGRFYPSMKKNPKYHGQWIYPKISNPNYKGRWKRSRILNPAYYNISDPFAFPSINGIGFEIWSVNKEMAFTNILITNDESSLIQWNGVDFLVRRELQVDEYFTITSRSNHAQPTHKSYMSSNSLFFSALVVFVLTFIIIFCYFKQRSAKTHID